jgi:hypothetical protein
MLKKIHLVVSSALLLGLSSVAQASNVESTHDDPYGFLYNSYTSLYDGESSTGSSDSSTSEEDPYDFLYEGRSDTPVSPEY